MKRLIPIIMAGCIVLAGAVTAGAEDNLIPPFGVQEITLANGVSYLSPSVADMANNGRAQLNLDNEAYDLKLIYDFGPDTGAAQSLINVKIQNAKGKVLIDAVVNGPWFFAKLPAGRYQVTTYYDRQYEIRNITVHNPSKPVVEDWTL